MNRNLGNYDMVLGLSSNKINSQFKIMYKRKIIHNIWAFLTNSMGRETLVDTDAKTTWENRGTFKKELSDKEQEKSIVDKQMKAAFKDKKYEEGAKLSDTSDALETEIETLKKKVETADIYDVALVANIAPPKIEILKDIPKELLFKIEFEKQSMLYYTREGKQLEFDLGPKDGTSYIYAFRVAIGQVRITTDKKILEIDPTGKEKEITLRDKGINDNDFTIQALFLDFENANIASYDEQNSSLPDDMNINASLQVALANYFRGIKGEDNQYILGYGINKNEVKEGEKALFYPSGVAYSTSFSREKRASIFNFLMLLNNHPFPSGGDAGVLPTSLLEYSQDKTPTINGVFGLNLKDFEANYLGKLSKTLRGKLQDRLGGKCKGVSAVGSYDSKVKFGWHNVDGGILMINYSGITGGADNKGIIINYDVTASASIHKEIEELIGTVGINWKNSTNGNYRNTNGKKGKLTVTLQAGASGKLDLKVGYQSFELGFDTQDPEYKDGLDEFWDAINRAIAAIINVFGEIVDFGDQLSGLDDLTDLGEALKIENLQNLENKIILPIATVYTYKNVRLLKGASDSDKVILFDTAYAAVSS